MKKIYLLPFLALSFVACNNDDDQDDDVSYLDNLPSTYTFTRDGNSSVSFSGQTERLNQLSEMTTYMKTGNVGGTIDAAQMLDMYANTNGNGNGAFSFTSTKQLKNKTIEGESGSIASMYEMYMTEMASISGVTDPASNGTAGIVESNEAGPYLVNAMGQEYTQLIEKGLMGAVPYYQITQVYLGDSKMDVDNSAIEDGKNYTTMEHHWDEAFGYFTSATDFPANESKRFWGKYSNAHDEILGTNDRLMNAFIKGRAAIVNKDYATRDNQITIIQEELYKVSAASAIHYLNDAIANPVDDAVRSHVTSEAVAFLTCLKYGAYMPMSVSEIDNLLSLIGDNYYELSIADLTQVRDAIAVAAGITEHKEIL